ncbi:hypothetical protein EST38_g371 [Candolleomyces aberdarensis]|uniref:DUF6533 domain-containing protein n=1 Tax=Candolleomyces aberdarensis TaxID=2316362 RepID=A0A4Q2E1E3_9AGAR|nr:hypothetical protein EST38_g371 [Candolleomyces aberdarensis]
MSYSPTEIARFTFLFTRSKVPLTVIPAALTWVLHDYFVTLEDEVRYIWSQRWSLAKFMFLFVRYYTLALLVFDVIQIHTFAIPGFVNDNLCVAIDPTTRLLGGISLWSIEIIMQLRIFALYNRSKKVALFNGVLFIISIGAFLWIMALGAKRRRALIASATRLPLPGCPVINGGYANWALWIPATAFELVLFGFVLYKSSRSVAHKIRLKQGVSLTQVLISDNIIYFFGVTFVLIFNNVMASGKTVIPWFSFG